MKKHYKLSSARIKKAPLFVLSLLLLSGLALVSPGKNGQNPLGATASAACLATAPPTTFGQVKQTVTVATAGTYRVWSRIKAPNTTANSYYFQTDTGACAYNVGDSTAIPANTWTWVNYQDGSTAAPINVTLTAGTHTLIYTGKEADVQLDKVMLLVDTACIPTTLGTNCAVTDTTSPTVSITAPTAGSTVSGTVNINATAADASGVASVDFLVDGVLKGTDTTAAYSFPLVTSTLTNGVHTLIAKATDTAGNTANSTSISVTVNNATSDATPPTVSMTATPTSVTAGATVTLAATAADNVGVAKVEFYNGTTLLTTDTATPFSFAWVTTGQTAGAKALTAKAYDAAGNVATSAAVSVTVTTTTGDTTAPVTSITAPATGTSVPVTTIVNITANATDNVAVSKVDFLIDGVLLNTDLTAPYTFPWNTTGVTAGAHALTVKASDAAGNVATSAAVSVTVTTTTGDTTAPVTALTAPVSGSSVALGTSVTVTATATDNIAVTRVEVYVDGVIKGTDTATPYSFAVATTGLTVGAHSITVKAFDAAGNSTTSAARTINITSTAVLPGDVNNDGRVNAIDLSSLISHDGQNFPAADFNGDGTVGAADMAVLLAKWTW